LINKKLRSGKQSLDGVFFGTLAEIRKNQAANNRA
jgi:hypothetical protein